MSEYSLVRNSTAKHASITDCLRTKQMIIVACVEGKTARGVMFESEADRNDLHD